MRKKNSEKNVASKKKSERKIDLANERTHREL